MDPGKSASDGESASAEFIDIGVLGSFSISVDGHVVTGLPVGSQRLLVFLALHDRTVSRSAVAAAMWPEATSEHAGVSLRSALARLEGLGREAIVAESAALSVTDIVHVDYQSEALQVFETYRGVLRDALDLEPTEQLSGLVSGLQG